MVKISLFKLYFEGHIQWNYVHPQTHCSYTAGGALESTKSATVASWSDAGLSATATSDDVNNENIA